MENKADEASAGPHCQLVTIRERTRCRRPRLLTQQSEPNHPRKTLGNHLPLEGRSSVERGRPTGHEPYSVFYLPLGSCNAPTVGSIDYQHRAALSGDVIVLLMGVVYFSSRGPASPTSHHHYRLPLVCGPCHLALVCPHRRPSHQHCSSIFLPLRSPPLFNSNELVSYYDFDIGATEI